MFVTFITISFFSNRCSNLITIEILVLLSWIPASKEFFIKIWKSDEKFAPSIEKIESITRKNMPIADDNEIFKKVQIKFISDTITTQMKDQEPPSRKRIRLDIDPDEQSSSINSFNPDGNLIKSLENITKEIQKLSQENAKLKVKTETLERMN